jgi:hypothetical protein
MLPEEGMSALRIEGEEVVLESGRRLGLEEIGALAAGLPWVKANVFIMPPHEYVVDAKLQSESEREAFAVLRYSCAHHPAGWKAFFRAYRASNRYLVLGSYRYWYTQNHAARMMNRCDRSSEVENTRSGDGVRAVRRWVGRAYAWKSEYGLECENVQRFCNLVVMDDVGLGVGRKAELVLSRYAAMVPRERFSEWRAEVGAQSVSVDVEEKVRRTVEGVEAISGMAPSKSKHVPSTGVEAGLGAVWMRQKNMSVPRVATDLRWFSGAPRVEVETVLWLRTTGEYLVQLNVPPAV